MLQGIKIDHLHIQGEDENWSQHKTPFFSILIFTQYWSPDPRENYNRKFFLGGLVFVKTQLFQTQPDKWWQRLCVIFMDSIYMRAFILILKCYCFWIWTNPNLEILSKLHSTIYLCHCDSIDPVYQYMFSLSAKMLNSWNVQSLSNI